MITLRKRVGLVALAAVMLFTLFPLFTQQPVYAEGTETLTKASDIADRVYTGKFITPKPVVKVKGKTLKRGRDYTVSYKNNKNVGTATVTIKGKGDYTGTIRKTFRILPQKTRLTAAIPGSVFIMVQWDPVNQKMAKRRITGYQFQIATNKSFTKGKRTFAVKGYQNSLLKCSGLTKNTSYFVRVRTYMKIGKKIYYSAWSKPKTVTTFQI